MPHGGAPPETRFTRAGDISIAYQVSGDGPPDILLALSYGSHQDLQWEEPRFAYFLRRIAQLGRLVTFDKRGTGLSDPLGFEPPLEARADDFRAVLDAVGSERAVVVATTGSCPPAIFFAATAPQRVAKLVLYNVAPRMLAAEGYPCGVDPRIRQFLLDALAEGMWGTGLAAEIYAPSLAKDPEFVRWMARYERAMASQQTAVTMVHVSWNHDVRELLHAIAAPTLVLARRSAPSTVEAARWTAEQIAGARFVELPGVDEYPFAGDSDSVVAAIAEFMQAEARPRTARAVRTVVFTDLVDSTRRARSIGDGTWHALLDSHDAVARADVSRFGGQIVKTTGDGILAVFEGPSQAVTCALSVRRSIEALGLELRAAVHTGEVELRADDVAGVAVHLAARLLDVAGPGQIVATSTVRDLTYGSDLVFEDFGSHELKGLGRWAVVQVREA